MQGIYTDYWGNAVVPYLTHYRRNTVTVNSGERDDLDIENWPKMSYLRKGQLSQLISARRYSAPY